jgi:hypothetical protein
VTPQVAKEFEEALERTPQEFRLDHSGWDRITVVECLRKVWVFRSRLDKLAIPSKGRDLY